MPSHSPLTLPMPSTTLTWSGSALPLDLSQQQQVLCVSDVGFGEQLPVGQASVVGLRRRMR